jgi:hypothetical protein
MPFGINQCPNNVSVMHEPHIPRSLEEINIGILQRHFGVQQDMTGASKALG